MERSTSSLRRSARASATSTPRGKRNAAAVSYKEESSSDDFSDTEAGFSEEAGRGSRRQRTSARLSYKEASSSEQSESDSPEPVQILKRNHAESAGPVPVQKRRRTGRRTTRSSTLSKRVASGRPKQVSITRLPQRHRPEERPAPTIPSDGVNPPWQTLPYEILLSVFRYALYPAHDDGFRPNPSINWLLRASRTCKAFTEPALSALYECPPLLYRDQPHDLLDLLAKGDGYLDYKSKIRRLELDSKRTLAYSTHGRGLLDIAALIRGLPNLTSVDISEPIDRPPYRQLTQKGRWHYPENLFPALCANGTRLKEWRWAGQMMGKHFIALDQILTLTPFTTLQHLTLSHLDFPPEPVPSNQEFGGIIASDDTRRVGQVFPNDLSSLKDLQSLSLESCHSEAWDVLGHLPNDLTSFSVVNCASFDSTILDPFLVEHGRKLKSLVLKHNHALDASWLVNLKAACPKLEVLRMDLTFFSSALLTQNADAEPVFEFLLEPGEMPSWPTTLREIEMLHLRQWSPEAAVSFFESLVQSSSELPVLRYMTIKAMLNISWRDRAGFREKWIGLLRSTFLRISQPPSPYLASCRAYRLWKQAIEKREAERKQKDTSSQTDSDRRVTRSAQNDNSDEEERSESLGTCEVVDISIDNMRPTETRLTEADFIDSEISGDCTGSARAMMNQGSSRRCRCTMK